MFNALCPICKQEEMYKSIVQNTIGYMILKGKISVDKRLNVEAVTKLEDMYLSIKTTVTAVSRL
ncbi:MAG TPA: hypothetical protein DEP04_01890 [Dehalococcoidia bacterium]|nr:hypothetical protein [Dehalococcoidia bacterium]